MRVDLEKVLVRPGRKGGTLDLYDGDFCLGTVYLPAKAGAMMDEIKDAIYRDFGEVEYTEKGES